MQALNSGQQAMNVKQPRSWQPGLFCAVPLLRGTNDQSSITFLEGFGSRCLRLCLILGWPIIEQFSCERTVIGSGVYR
jgi:hypothetical protein